MTPDVVVDVGNTAIKWGRCAGGAVQDTCSLPPDGPSAWLGQAGQWGLAPPQRWAVSSVHPPRRDRLVDWLRQRGDSVAVVEDPRDLPLRVLLERPDHVGIDRLTDAVAANSRRPAGVPAVIVDAGSAVTVDWLDETGAFRGGAILPGLQLMAKALHEHTALLPFTPPPYRLEPVPGTATVPAMRAGIWWAVAGGIEALVRAYRKLSGPEPMVFLTGGDGPALAAAWERPVHHWPTMTLEGIRLAAEALP
jgi:type III pantothenate kinase